MEGESSYKLLTRIVSPSNRSPEHDNRSIHSHFYVFDTPMIREQSEIPHLRGIVRRASPLHEMTPPTGWFIPDRRQKDRSSFLLRRLIIFPHYQDRLVATHTSLALSSFDIYALYSPDNAVTLPLPPKLSPRDFGINIRLPGTACISNGVHHTMMCRVT